MKFSKIFVPTAKEAPKDALLPSHIYLIRGGFIEQLGSGLYNYLPLGKMVLDNIKNVVKEEMDRAGAQEVVFNFITPAQFWKQSGRYSAYGKELLRFKDRKNNEFILSPTNEESAVEMVRGRVTSYKQLPLHLYHINTKFRDEARPRFGLLRGREFLMKDGYSFHEDEADLTREFENMYETYSRIFTRLGLNFRAVDADSGAIGGSGSKEFMVLAKNGEDDILVCDSCSYAANIEAAKRAKKSSNAERPEFNMMGKFKTPGVNTIKDVAEFCKVDSFFTINAVIKKAIYESSSEIVLFFIRGCDELQEVKALNACGALELEDASSEEIKKVGLIAGYCGPAGLPATQKFYIDSELKGERDLICGANEEDYHIIGFNVVSFKDERFADLVAVDKGDECLVCGGKLTRTKGIEVGHIFKLGQRYSAPMEANFLDRNGKAKPFYMGCYGIGVSRLIAVAVESSHDEKGVIWSKELAPFELVIIISSLKDEEQVEFANKIYKYAQNLGIKVLLDDRDERYGVKISEFELIGFPCALIIGKGLKDGKVELIKRKNLERKEIKTSEIKECIKELLG
ncbi:MAG: proline--tRNA ligase [Campylobacter sp.]|nr:proline--tRNA ligase [Campylobacter sp.]